MMTPTEKWVLRLYDGYLRWIETTGKKDTRLQMHEYFGWTEESFGLFVENFISAMDKKIREKKNGK